jgi:large subunit ribosomal protein LP2
MDGWINLILIVMKYLAAYLLLNAGGKASPAAEDIKSLLSSVGIESDEERLSSLIAALGEKDINEVGSFN